MSTTISIVILGIYVIGYLIAILYFAYDSVRVSDMLTVGDLCMCFITASVWPMLAIDRLAKRFPIMTMNVSDIVLWRKGRAK